MRPNPLNKLDQFNLFHHEFHYIRGQQRFLLPVLLLPLIQRGTGRHQLSGQEPSWVSAAFLSAGWKANTLTRSYSGQEGGSSTLWEESYKQPEHAWCFYPALFVSGTTTVSFKKPQVHGYFQFLRLFSKTSTGHSPKRFTSFGYYVKTLAKKKDALKKKKDINRNTHSVYRLCSPLGTPKEQRRRSLVQWFRLSGLLQTARPTVLTASPRACSKERH